MENVKESAKWNCKSRVKKYHEVLETGKESEFYSTYNPYEVIEMEGNALIEAGVDVMWNLICGVALETPFDNANSTLEVYITASYVAGVLDGSYPTCGADGKASWKAAWAGALGDGPWSKWKVTNGVVNMNEKAEALGTKSGGTWTLEVDITIT